MNALNTVTILDLPTPSADANLLPCERAFNASAVDPSIDCAFLNAVAKKTDKPARYIPMASLRVKKPGYRGIDLPVFDMIDPFYDHGGYGPALTAKKMLALPMQYANSNVDYAISQCFEKDRSVLIGYINGGYTSYKSTLCEVFLRAGPWTIFRHDTFGSRQTVFALYSTIPGYIPPEYREKIRRANGIALATDGAVRLIIEADWKLAEEVTVTAKQADPLIVIVKKDTVAYIDRFDCTTAEENLAREHAVRLP